jgi:hypothetical protein
MKFLTGQQFSFNKNMLVTFFNLFYSTNVDSSQVGNIRKETVTIKKYKNINRIYFALDETIPFKSIKIDEFIPIKY